jgi:hypothetical protein
MAHLHPFYLIRPKLTKGFLEAIPKFVNILLIVEQSLCSKGCVFRSASNSFEVDE